MILLNERRFRFVLILPVLVFAFLTVLSPAAAVARSHVAEGGSPGGEGKPNEWGSPRQTADLGLWAWRGNLVYRLFLFWWV